MFKQIKAVLCTMLMLLFSTTNVLAVSNSALSDNSCVVVVKDSGGDLVKYTKITTEVSGGLFCTGGRDFETDSNGKATLLWVEGCKLKKVYVKGKAYDVEYQNGKTYTLIIK